VAAGLAPLFVWQERRAPEPLVPLHLFGRRAIGVSTFGAVFTGWLLFGQTTFVPPFVQGVMGASPTVAGFVMAGSSIGWPLASWVGGRVVLRWGFRLTSMLGAVILVLGYVLLWRMPPDAALWYPTLTQFITGAGFGFASLVFILAAQNAVGWEQRGVVTGANQFARSMGGTIGVSIAGAIFATGVAVAAGAGVNPNDLLSPSVRASLPAADLQQLEAALVNALHSVYALFVGIAAATILVAALLPGGKPPDAPPERRDGRVGSESQQSLVSASAD
jgi:MFS family permease